MVSKCHHNSFLNSLPESFQSLTDPDLGIICLKLVRKPNLDEAVFFKVLEDIGEVQNGANAEFVRMSKNDIFLESYSTIRMFLESGSVQLI
jgi:hypothetical protein